MPNNRTFLTHHLPAILCALAIFGVSSIPDPQAPGIGLPFADKIFHFNEFGIFGFLLVRAVGASEAYPSRRSLLLALWIGWTWAGLDEIHQMLIPGRCASAYDLVADSLGFGTGMALLYAIRSRSQRRRSQHSPESVRSVSP